jgi:hypothetical protein
MKRATGILFLLVLIQAVWVRAEYTFFTPPGSFAVEVSLENWSELRMPVYRNAITSLEVVGDWAVGGTSADAGLSPFVFSVSLSRRRLEVTVDLATVVQGQRAICSGFGPGPGGKLYAGTMPDVPGESGHLIQIDTGGRKLDVKDLGIPLKGEGIFAVAVDARRSTLYGISHPSGKLIVYDLAGNSTRIFQETAPTLKTVGFLHAYAVKPVDYLCRRLVLDKKGRVFGSMPVSRVFRFDPEKRVVETLPDPMPEVWGRSPLGRVDCWALGPDGILYGGNAADGQLFTLNPDTGKITNLGKPTMMPRLKGMAFGADGKLYGISGGVPGYSHLFGYEPGGSGFSDLGNPRFTMVAKGIEQGIFWRGFQIGAIAASEDGRLIVMGEEEALSQIMVFPVATFPETQK